MFKVGDFCRGGNSGAVYLILTVEPCNPCKKYNRRGDCNVVYSGMVVQKPSGSSHSLFDTHIICDEYALPLKKGEEW